MLFRSPSLPLSLSPALPLSLSPALPLSRSPSLPLSLSPSLPLSRFPGSFPFLTLLHFCSPHHLAVFIQFSSLQLSIFLCTPFCKAICDWLFQDVDECQGDSCIDSNTVTCNNTIGSYTCVCKDGYEGVNCERPTCADPDLCSGNGVCSTNATHWLCTCSEFYEGMSNLLSAILRTVTQNLYAQHLRCSMQ